MLLVGIYIAVVFLHGLAAGRLERTVLTAPLVFTAAGVIALLAMPELRDRQASPAALLDVAEIGLVLLLFTDASRTELRLLCRSGALPARLLSTGLLLTIVAGGLAALGLFRDLSVWEAGILGAILAPTDAGLGQIIVTSPRVPPRIRQALNVEAGLNDGLSVPFLLFFISLAAARAGGAHASMISLIAEQLGLGVLIGGGVGLVGGVLLGAAHRAKWTTGVSAQLGIVALPLLSLMFSEATGASGFIAAFVAGLTVQIGFKDAGRHSVEFSEEWGQLFNLFVFFLFGILSARAWRQFEFSHAIYAVLSLTVIRMVPVAIALLGTGLSRPTVVFIGWFGPRGLASIVLGLVYIEHAQPLPDQGTIRLTVMMTVLLSIMVHGVTALPGINWYAARVARLGPDSPEHSEPGQGPELDRLVGAGSESDQRS